MAGWAAGLGYKGIQIPTWDGRLFDLERAATSRAYCDEVLGVVHGHGLEITELSTHLQGQLVAVHPAYDEAFDAFAPPAVQGHPAERQAWAMQQLQLAAQASANLGLDAQCTFSGAFAWPFVYPWPQRPAGLIETAFDELAKRWKPIFDACDEAGIDVGFEVHPGEDLFDGVTFEMLLERVGQPPALRHQLRPVALRPAVPRLSRVHRHLPRAHQGLPREGRRVQPGRPPGRLLRLPVLGEPCRPLPLARRRPGRFRRRLLAARRARLRLVGGARVGVLPEEPRAGRGRGGAVHRALPDPGD